MSNKIDSQTKHKRAIEGLLVKHRAERLSKEYGLKINAEYFAQIHNRALPSIYKAFNGGMPRLLSKMNRHLDVVEERCRRKAS